MSICGNFRQWSLVPVENGYPAAALNGPPATGYYPVPPPWG